MKKRNRKKSIQTLVTLSLMICLLIGCSKVPTPTDETAQTDTLATVEEEATISEDPEVVEEETIVEDPGEVTYITDFVTINEYVDTLDPSQPAILIYNETEKYIINMQEGQHYQLKSTDQIVFNAKDLIGCGWDPDLGNETMGFANVSFLKANYSAWKKDQEFFFSKSNEKDENIILTCYLTPPTE